MREAARKPTGNISSGRRVVYFWWPTSILVLFAGCSVCCSALYPSSSRVRIIIAIEDEEVRKTCDDEEVNGNEKRRKTCIRQMQEKIFDVIFSLSSVYSRCRSYCWIGGGANSAQLRLQMFHNDDCARFSSRKLHARVLPFIDSFAEEVGVLMWVN